MDPNDNNKRPPEYGDASNYEHPPAYNPSNVQNYGPLPPIPHSFAPGGNQPPPDYQGNIGFAKTVQPTQPVPVTIQLQQYVPAQTTPTAQVATHFGPYPQSLLCPGCNQSVTTRVEYKAGLMAWLAAAACCFFGGWCGCFLIPCCIDATRDVEHSCTRCGFKVGRYRRL